MGIIDFFKDIGRRIKGMFLAKNQVEKHMQVKTVISGKMEQAIGLWNEMYTNHPPWEGDVDYGACLNLPAAICSEISRLVLTDFADHLVIEVLDDMKVIEHRLNPGTFFLEGLLKIRIHVTGNGFHGVHPFQTNMFDKIIDHLLFLPMGDPKDMAGIKVYDVGGITVAVVELEFINGEYLCRMFRFDQLCAIDGIEFLKADQIDVFDCVLSEPCDLSHLFECIGSECQKIPGILVQLHGYLMAFRFEWHSLHMGMPTAAGKLHAIKTDCSEASAKAQMPECKVPMAVNVHTTSTLRASAVSFHQIKLAIEAKHFPSGNGSHY